MNFRERLRKPVEVPMEDGGTMTIMVPKAADILALRTESLKLAKDMEPYRKNVMGAPEELLNRQGQLTAKAVRACINAEMAVSAPDEEPATLDEATQIIGLAGGDGSELAMRCMQLCGLSSAKTARKAAKQMEEQLLDPTSSPEDSDAA